MLYSWLIYLVEQNFPMHLLEFFLNLPRFCELAQKL